MRIPDYDGGGLVNLVAEIERRLTGTSPSPGLHRHLAEAVPDAEVYVIVLFDGLGDLQLAHHVAGTRLWRDRRGGLDSSFSTQTSVATATLATGLPPSRHGLLAYLLPLSEDVVNTLWWLGSGGDPAGFDLEQFLPTPNLAERLAAAGVSAVVVQPDAYLGTPLDRVLYRGAESLGTADPEDMIEAAREAAAVPGRLVVAYLPHVDAAGHAEGTGSDGYAAALDHVAGVWDRLSAALPPGVALIGTADHGMVDIPLVGAVEFAPREGVTLYGDSRVLYVRGDTDAAALLAARLPATWVDDPGSLGLWGPEPYHPEFLQRAPDGLILADPGHTLHPAHDHLRLVGNHGGLTEAELRIPLLVADRT